MRSQIWVAGQAFLTMTASARSGNVQEWQAYTAPIVASDHRNGEKAHDRPNRPLLTEWPLEIPLWNELFKPFQVGCLLQ